MTELKMTDQAIAKLQKLMPGKTILLDMDDGVGPFSAVGVCSLNTHFNIVLAAPSKVTTDFNVELSSPVGPVLVKDYSTEYFGSQPKLDLGMGDIFTLSDESGLLDGALGTITVDEDAVVPAGQSGPAANC